MSDDRVSREENRIRWEGIVQQQSESGLSAAAFCREQQISYQSFGYWKRRLQRGDEQPLVQSSRFQEVRIAPGPEPEGMFEVILGAVTIRVPSRFAELDLQKILRVVAGGC